MMSQNQQHSGESSFGDETRKALENFGMGTPSADPALSCVPPQLITAYAEVKWAALEAVQEEESRFSAEQMAVLRQTLTGIIRGEMDDAFPLPMAQGGAGTSLHLNLNEVLAAAVKQAGLPAPDPFEDLARFQSTNDTFASAVVIMAFRLAEKAEEDTISLQEILVDLEGRFDHILMTGRTELRDALPMRAGTLFGAWAGAAERDRWRLSKVAERVREIPLGGTALGTGFGAPRSYSHSAERHLRRITGLPLARSQNMADGVALKDSLAEVAGALKLASSSTARIAGDLLFYASSPVGEIVHPELQYGSSMMPLKANPVLLERCRGLALSAMGEADKTALYATEGQLQLNAYLPFLCRSLSLCARETSIARNDLIRYLSLMEVRPERMEANLARSAAMLNALTPILGYRALKTLAEEVEKEAPETLDELAALAARHTRRPVEEIRRALSPGRLAGPPPGESLA